MYTTNSTVTGTIRRQPPHTHSRGTDQISPRVWRNNSASWEESDSCPRWCNRLRKRLAKESRRLRTNGCACTCWRKDCNTTEVAVEAMEIVVLEEEEEVVVVMAAALEMPRIAVRTVVSTIAATRQDHLVRRLCRSGWDSSSSNSMIRTRVPEGGAVVDMLSTTLEAALMHQC